MGLAAPAPVVGAAAGFHGDHRSGSNPHRIDGKASRRGMIGSLGSDGRAAVPQVGNTRFPV